LLKIVLLIKFEHIRHIEYKKGAIFTGCGM